jgi:hypothetical protein
MAKPPVTEQTATAAQLDEIYSQHNFEALLKRCLRYEIENRTCGPNHPLHPDTRAKLGLKFRLHGGPTVAVVFYYTHANKTVTRHIRMLRVGDTKFCVPKQAPVHAQIG